MSQRRNYAELAEENGSLKRRHVELLDEVIRLRKLLNQQHRRGALEEADLNDSLVDTNDSSCSSASSVVASSYCPETEEWRDLSLRLMHLIVSSGKFHQQN